MVRIRKQAAGSDSFGNVWKNDGDVVEVAPDQARSLLQIPDGGFSEVPADEAPSRKPSVRKSSE